MNTKQIAEEAFDKVCGNEYNSRAEGIAIIQAAIEKALAKERERTATYRDLWHGRAAHASELQFDPNFQIPPEIMEAAYTVHNYAIRSGFGKGWCIGPVCDRDAHASDNQ